MFFAFSGCWTLCLLGVIVAYFILSYYLVIAGWTLGFIVSISTGSVPQLESFTSNIPLVLGYMFLFTLATIHIVNKGLQKGIEKYGKILMPLLLIMLLILVFRSLTLPNNYEGILFYLYPDWSEVHPKIFLYALSQTFFSLCVGEAVLITYGSYASKKEDLVSSAIAIALFDTLIAILSGLIIFPALASFGEDPNQGMGLIFSVIPKILMQLPFGQLLGTGFFLMLSFAALTTCIALLEIPVTFITETTSLSRHKASWSLGLLAFILGIPSALSKGANDFLTNFSIPLIPEKGFYEVMDFTWGALGMVLTGLALSLFTGWVWGTSNACEELQHGAPYFKRFSKVWAFIVKYLAPLVIIFILIGLFF